MNDFLIRLARGEQPVAAAASSDVVEAPKGEHVARNAPRALSFASPSLDALGRCSTVRERMEVLRVDAAAAPTSDVVTFAARNRSRWALEVLVQRFTRGLLDWDSLRVELLRAHASGPEVASTLEQISPSKLWLLRQALSSHHLDPEAEHAILVAVADRVLAGERFDKSALPALAVNLIGAGLDKHVRQLLRIYTSDTYLRHALTVELAHPRFGGSHELLLSRFNQIYRRFGLEPVTTEGPGSVPFTQLRAEPAERIEGGPLVSVIMSCWSPGEELLLAVRSIIDQTYQNWELLVTDDASPDEFSHVLDQVAAMDTRIRVVRNAENAGTYVRRNEALDLAQGEFVTMQDSDDWSHPRRIEIQVRDLLDAQHRLANIIYNVRLTEDLSLYSERGMQLGLCEPAIMFRRERVMEKVGYFDDIRKAADREFRQRLEAVTGVPVAVVGPEIPLVLMLADVGSLSGSDFRGKWVHPARIAYRSSMLRTHDLISDGEQTALFPARQVSRTLDAPEALLGRSTAPSHLDLLVILDGRSHATRRSFLAGVVEELRAALECGLTIGVMHSDSLLGGKQQGYFDLPLQRLIDEEGLHRVIEGQQISASTVVVRHAVSAQGHPAETLQVATDRVVIVEDASGGDKRGLSFAKGDVVDTVTAWFSAEATWQTAEPRPLPPAIESVVVDEDDLRIVVRCAEVSGHASLELRGAEVTPIQHTPLKPRASAVEDEEPVERLLAARLPLSTIGSEPFQVVARLGSYAYVLEVELARVLTLSATHLLVRRPGQRLQLISGDAAPSHSLRAMVRAIHIDDGRLKLNIEPDERAKLTRVVAVREVRGTLRRRGLALKATADGHTLASRQIAPLAEVRWRLFGIFQTPVGRVQHPLFFDAGLQAASSGEWHAQPDGDHVIQLGREGRQGRATDIKQTGSSRPGRFRRWLHGRTGTVST
ncbi:glycosyltransferase family 2 protein [Microbacterium sp. USHLN186]|uniref:glycosyltransferase family 2 protein n=1 Tax=Microbacterium sp. USHLN186 TaxID=3081286 RepID=UPI003017A36E